MKQSSKEQQSTIPAEPSVEAEIEEQPKNPVVAAMDHTEGRLSFGKGDDGLERIETLGKEIRRRHHALVRVSRRSLEEAIVIGGLMAAAKTRLGHGEWYPCLEEAGVKTRTAQNYMRLYEERESVRVKSALDADLTIIGSLTALRAPKAKSDSARLGEESQARKSSSAPERNVEEADQAEGDHETNPSDVDSRKNNPQGAKGTAPTAPSLLPAVHPATASLEGIHTASAKPENDQDSHSADSASPGYEPKENQPSPDSEGFVSVDGTQWPFDAADDGLIPAEQTRVWIKQLKENNERARDEHKRSIAALKITESIIIELARTANRLGGTLEATSEDVMVALDEAVNLLRNFTHTTPPVAKRWMHGTSSAA